jgi:Ni/Co efflux regulator RcnB
MKKHHGDMSPMKSIITLLLIAAAPALALAQAATPAKSTDKPAAKAQASTAAKPKPKLAPSARKAVEEVTPIDDDPNIKLSEADVEMARKVYVGEIKCELGASVKLTPMKREGMFMVTTKGHRFRMHPVESRTGAIRLEDPQRGAMWLQLGNKSMLMSQKLGQRLADECQSPEQLTYAEALKKNPLPSILDSTPGPQSTQTTGASN